MCVDILCRMPVIKQYYGCYYLYNKMIKILNYKRRILCGKQGISFIWFAIEENV